MIILKYDTFDESEKLPKANSWENNYHFHLNDSIILNIVIVLGNKFRNISSVRLQITKV